MHVICLMRQDALQGVLCVETDNSAVKGDFFSDPGYPSATTTFAPNGPGVKHKNFWPRKDETSHLESTSNDAFHLGDPISVHYAGEENSVASTNAFGQVLRLPFAGDGGFCNDLNAIQFGHSIKTSCLRNIKDIAVTCENDFSTSHFTSYNGMSQLMLIAEIILSCVLGLFLT